MIPSVLVRDAPPAAGGRKLTHYIHPKVYMHPLNDGQEGQPVRRQTFRIATPYTVQRGFLALRGMKRP